MRSAGRAVVLRDKDILMMKRFKMGATYYTLPGGRVEAGESPEDCAIREVKEETSIIVTNPRLVYVEEAGDPFGMQYIYKCDYQSGEPVLPPESEEAFWTIPDKNTYEPVWLQVDQLESVPIVSPLLKEALINALKNGFPDQPVSFSSKHAQRLS